MCEVVRHGSIAVLRLDADDNRLSGDVLDAWDSALDEVEEDGDVTAFVSIGLGRFYSNGLDVDVLTAGAETAGPYLDRVLKLLTRIVALPVATVAAVNGHAFGAGAMLALAHDARVMRQDRRFLCLPEVDLGRPFLPSMRELITAKWPPNVAQEAMLTGRRYRGSEAAERSMVDLAVADSDMLDSALRLAASRGGKDRRALGAIKHDLYGAITRVADG